MPTAIVTGATGMTGTAMVGALIETQDFTEIYTLSHSQKPASHSKVKHATLDLQSSADEMCKSLSHIPAVTHIFFCAYLANADEAEATRINGTMLQNFLDALSKSGKDEKLERFQLTCGLKQFGVHLGQPKNPMREDDDPALFWLEQEDRPPNFYYAQQRILERAAKQSGDKWSWVCTYPQDVVGFAKANFMNLATALGLYCAVSKEAGHEMVFPGSKRNYMAFNVWTSARLHAQFCLWAARTPAAGNERFIVVNGDVESWQDLWPRLAALIDSSIPESMFPDENGAYPGFEDVTNKLHPRPPVSEVASKIGLKGEFKPSQIHMQIDLIKWAKRPEIIQAWERLRDRHGLDQGAWDHATWEFLDFLLGRDFSCVASMSKARRLGWIGYADTWSEFERTFKELAEAKMLPHFAS